MDEAEWRKLSDPQKIDVLMRANNTLALKIEKLEKDLATLRSVIEKAGLMGSS